MEAHLAKAIGRSKNYKNFNFKKMNKADLADAVHAKLGGTKVQAEEVVESYYR